MLSQILKYLIALLQQQNYLDSVKGLANTIKRDGEKITGYYENGELQPIDFDSYTAFTFFLQKGKVSRTTDENKFVACAYKIKETYSLSIVVYLQGLEDINCESRAQNMAWSIGQLLTGKHSNLINDTGLDYVQMSVKNIDLDKNSIYESLFTGDSKLKDTDILIEISFDVEIEGEEKCFTTYPCVVTVQGDTGENTAFGTDETNNNELINGNP